MFHVRKVVAEGGYARLCHPLRDGLKGKVSHVGAGAVTQHKQVARAGGPEQQGGDLSLLRRGKEFRHVCIVSHFAYSLKPRISTTSL